MDILSSTHILQEQYLFLHEFALECIKTANKCSRFVPGTAVNMCVSEKRKSCINLKDSASEKRKSSKQRRVSATFDGDANSFGRSIANWKGLFRSENELKKVANKTKPPHFNNATGPLIQKANTTGRHSPACGGVTTTRSDLQNSPKTKPSIRKKPATGPKAKRPKTLLF